MELVVGRSDEVCELLFNSWIVVFRNGESSEGVEIVAGRFDKVCELLLDGLLCLGMGRAQRRWRYMYVVAGRFDKVCVHLCCYNQKQNRMIMLLKSKLFSK